jgi:hypothetical protein
MNARRILMLAAALLLTFHSIAQGQTPVPAVAPTAAPAAVAAARPAVAPATPVAAPNPVRATVAPEAAPEAQPAWTAFDQQTPPPPPPPPPPTPKKTLMPTSEAEEPHQAPKVVMPKAVLEATPKAVLEGAPKVAMATVQRKMIAVKVEFTISDQIGNKPPTRKMMTMTIGSGEFSRIRTNAAYYQKVGNSTERRSAPLAIDVRPNVEGNKIWLDFMLEYNLLDDPPAEGIPGGNTSVSESLAAVLDSGVPLVVAQSSDALSDRKITIEVKATVMK